MKAADRDAVHERFAAGETDVAVAPSACSNAAATC